MSKMALYVILIVCPLIMVLDQFFGSPVHQATMILVHFVKIFIFMVKVVVALYGDAVVAQQIIMMMVAHVAEMKDLLRIHTDEEVFQ